MDPIDQRITVWQGRVTVNVKIAGDGPPLVFLHGASGLQWDPYLQGLSADHTVYAIEHPGTSEVDREAIRSVNSIWDLVLCYDEMFDALGLGAVTLVGHSFGGMVAAEIAASYPSRVANLVLLAPVGLWQSAAPVKNWMVMQPAELVRATFHDPGSPVAQMMTALLENPMAAGPDLAASTMWALACTGRFVWPIPDKGLDRRIHRIAGPTLILWGVSDGIVPISYAALFEERIAQAQVARVEGAGHALQLEAVTDVLDLTRAFLAEQAAAVGS